MGASIPGAPGLPIGRNPDLAWGATYTFMDATDSWIENCKDGMYFREPDRWIPFSVRKEIIRRKKKPPMKSSFMKMIMACWKGTRMSQDITSQPHGHRPLQGREYHKYR